MSLFLFGDYASSSKEYVRIENIETLPTKLNDYLIMYNSMHPK